MFKIVHTSIQRTAVSVSLKTFSSNMKIVTEHGKNVWMLFMASSSTLYTQVTPIRLLSRSPRWAHFYFMNTGELYSCFFYVLVIYKHSQVDDHFQ